MNNHIITTRNGQGKALKCLHCNRFSRLKLKKGLMNYAKELADFERVHQYCQPQADGRSLRYTSPTPPANEAKPYCLICGKEFKPMEGKIPLYRDDKLSDYSQFNSLPVDPSWLNKLYRNDQLSPAYAHVDCFGSVTGGWRVGHHNLVVQSEGEWLYFWQGQCGSARNKAEAVRLLGELSEGVGL